MVKMLYTYYQNERNKISGRNTYRTGAGRADENRIKLPLRAGRQPAEARLVLLFRGYHWGWEMFVNV